MNQEPKFKKVVDAADGLSLGISIVVAVLIGVGVGMLLQKITAVTWTFWIGIVIGVSAAILNVYKAYIKQKRSLDALAKDPRYNRKQRGYEDDMDEDEKY